MRKTLFILISTAFVSTLLAGYFSFSIGFAVSGTAFPYVGIYYKMENFGVGGSLGFVVGPDEKNPSHWVYIFSPSVEMEYIVKENFFIIWNTKAIVVFPYQSEQLYLTGVGVGYSFPIWKGSLGIKLDADLILPISAGKKAWDRGKLAPIPFVEAMYEFKITSLNNP